MNKIIEDTTKRKEWIDKFFKLRYPPYPKLSRLQDSEYLKEGELMEIGHLYKYLNVKGLHRFLYNLINDEDNLMIHFSTPDKFNDPYDTWLPFVYYSNLEVRNEISNEYCKLICNIKKLDNDQSDKCLNDFQEINSINDTEKWIKELSKNINKYVPNYKSAEQIEIDFKENIKKVSVINWRKHQQEFIIACLSEINDSILMWSHYSENHKGICISYDTSDFFEPKYNKMLPLIQPVRYQQNMGDIIQEASKAISDSPSGNSGWNMKWKAILTKSIDWEYEREWRIVFQIKPSDSTPHNIPLTPDCIYLGANMDSEDEKAITKLAKKKGIRVMKMKMELNEYKLSSIDV